ncbi:MAG: hypothetical protein JST30_08765 [Armatimonadetes bacterium]|nr:hypothetical protein [Armatimonadota bacterium]
MFDRSSVPFDPRQIQATFESASFKVCPLCGNLCVDGAHDCFVCGWAGTFEHDKSLVDLKLRDLVRRCPELEGLLGPPSFARRAKSAVFRALRAFRRRLDVSV